MLLVLARGGHLQAGQRVGDLAVLHQEFEPNFGVLFLIVGGLGEDGADLLVAFLLGLGCKVGVLVAGLALTCESLPQVFSVLLPPEFHSEYLRFKLGFVLNFLLLYHKKCVCQVKYRKQLLCILPKTLTNHPK